MNKKGPIQNVAAHFFDQSLQQWIVIDNHKKLSQVLGYSSPKPTALVTMAHINMNQFGENFFTVKYEINRQNPVMKPKIQVKRDTIVISSP